MSVEPLSRARAQEIINEQKDIEFNNIYEALCIEINRAILEHKSELVYKSTEKNMFDWDYSSMKTGPVRFYKWLEEYPTRLCDKLRDAYKQADIILYFEFTGRYHWFWGDSRKVTIYIRDSHN